MKCFCRKASEGTTDSVVPLKADDSSTPTTIISSTSASTMDPQYTNVIPLNANGTQTENTSIPPPPEASTTVAPPVSDSSQAPGETTTATGETTTVASVSPQASSPVPPS